MPAFIAGIELNRRLYNEVVQPLLQVHFPALRYAAGLLGTGSDVLGFDTAMSTDHDWGPSLVILLKEADFKLAAAIDTVLRQNLPPTFYDYPVSYGPSPDPNEPHTRLMQASSDGSVNHRVTLTTVRAFCVRQVNYNTDQPLDVIDWLTFPSQKLLEVTSGAVYHDGVGEITAIRARLAYYPPQVWLYLLAASWQRLGQEDHLMSRAGYVGDELGSAVIGSRLVRDVMSLCFLLEKQYAPYPKWFGTAFKRLECATVLEPVLRQAQQANTRQTREVALGTAYEYLANRHNALGITNDLPEKVVNFHNRPFKVSNSAVFVAALLAQITDPVLKRLATSRPLIGGVDQFSDSTDLRAKTEWRPILRKLYE